jgi:hypothetical protein
MHQTVCSAENQISGSYILLKRVHWWSTCLIYGNSDIFLTSTFVTLAPHTNLNPQYTVSRYKRWESSGAIWRMCIRSILHEIWGINVLDIVFLATPGPVYPLRNSWLALIGWQIWRHHMAVPRVCRLGENYDKSDTKYWSTTIQNYP